MLMVDHIYLEYTDDELNQMEEDASTMEALFHLQNINCKKRQRLARSNCELSMWLEIEVFRSTCRAISQNWSLCPGRLNCLGL